MEHDVRTWQRARAALREALAGRRRGRRGMSMVEVMVVIAIIVTLMSIIGFGAMQLFEDSKTDTTLLQMHEVNKKIELYSLRQKVPSTADGLKSVYGDTPAPRDSWGNEFVYVSPGPQGYKFDIVSYGADGAEGGTGNDADIRWSEQKK